MGGSASSSLETKSAGGVSLGWALNSSELLVVDVRGDEEAKSSPYPGSKNIPISEFEGRIGELGEDKTRPIVMHCRSGMRSGNCCEVAKRAGYVNVFSVANAEELKNLMNQAKTHH
jgi:phage shock protein E